MNFVPDCYDRRTDWLIVPKVNHEIWAMTHIQSYLAKAVIPALKLMQEMREMIKSGRGNKTGTLSELLIG